MRRHSNLTALVAALVLSGAAAVGAQSPSPDLSGSAPPVPSSAAPSSPGVPADLTCEDLAGLLPRSLAAWPLIWSAAQGAAEPVPGYPVADLAASLGVTPADICTVTFHYNEVVDGTIVRFPGAEQAGLLDAYIEDVRATTLKNGFSLLTQPLDLAGRPGIGLLRDGFERAAWQVGDMVVEMPFGWADEVSAYLPADGAPLPQVSPPPPGATTPPVMKALKTCNKLYDYLSGRDGRIQLSASSGFGPDVIDQSGTLLDPTASPAIMTDGLFDQLGISPFDVCLTRFTYGDTEAKIWRLGKGGSGTLQAYLDDVTATVEAGGGTVVRGKEKVAKKKVTTLTVTLPTGERTYYYLDLGGRAFVEVADLDNVKQVIPIVVIPKKN